MSQERIHMKKLRELIRLKTDSKLSNRQLGAILNVSASTISYYLRGLNQADISWPLAKDLTDYKLLELVEPHCRQLRNSRVLKTEPCWKTVHKEMQYKHMTVQLIYEEYVEQNPPPHYSYSHFCREYKLWRKKQDISMPLTHEYGDKCFIDYAGDTIPIYSRNSSTIVKAQIFIAVLGASKLTFALATVSQKIPDWIHANVAALEFFNGVPGLLVPDNLKSAVTNSCKYDPVINHTYTEFAAHYNTAILPARSYKPKDKAAAENGVLIVERWVMARLRKHKFYSLDALNTKIKELITVLNNKPFQKKPGSRNSVFLEQEQPKLKPLPKHRYEAAVFKTVKVQKDYHVCIDNHFYSVPYYLTGCYVECRVTNNTIEVLHDGQRITSHLIKKDLGGRTTLDAHMPLHHNEHKNWSEDKFLEWAKKIGTGAYNLAVEIINKNSHRDKVYRFHLGLKKLARQYSTIRLEGACLRALAIHSFEYKSLCSILNKKLDLQSSIEIVNLTNDKINSHKNIRGKNYFNQHLKEIK